MSDDAIAWQPEAWTVGATVLRIGTPETSDINTTENP